MNSMVLKLFTAYMSLQMLLVAAQAPGTCPVCNCGNDDKPIVFERPTLFSKISDDDLSPNQASSSQWSPAPAPSQTQIPQWSPSPSQPPRWTPSPSQSPSQPQPQSPSPATSTGYNHMGPNEISASAQLFSREMLKVLATYPPVAEKNFVVSPFSIWSLMILVAEGAADKSLTQLKNVLHLPSYLNQFGLSYRDLRNNLFFNSSQFSLDVNQAFFVDRNRPVEESYIRVLQADYQTDYVPVDFNSIENAVKTINTHIRTKTHGKIKQLVNEAAVYDTHLLLSSAIHFNGAWKFPFNATLTTNQKFYNEDGTPLGTVPMMTQQFPFRYAALDKLSTYILELPYGEGDRLGMLLIYPVRNASLESIFNGLRDVTIEQIYAQLYKYEEFGDSIITLPRFSIDTGLHLQTFLRQMGIVDVFDAGRARLPKMSKQPTYISNVFHRAILQVDEVGTIAAASTYANAIDLSYPMEFTLDRPFGFLLCDRLSHSILFAGQVRDPSETL